MVRYKKAYLDTWFDTGVKNVVDVGMEIITLQQIMDVKTATPMSPDARIVEHLSLKTMLWR